MAERIQHVCKRAYRALELSGYARIDLRLDDAGNVVGARGEPEPADRQGRGFRGVGREGRRSSYEALLQRIINLGLRWQPESVA